eukprot:Skav203512  [mRNA]  locus=scaffold1752:36596:37771:- [translate_table: standard]
MQYISGNTFEVTTTLGKTVNQFRKEDLSNIREDKHLIFDQQLMLNQKTLHGYHIEEGSVISIVKVAKQTKEAEDETDTFAPPPRVAVEPTQEEPEVESEEEDEVLETPYMSDNDDEAQLDESNLMQIVIRNYHTKHDMFRGQVDITQSMDFLLDYVTQFEDILTEDKAGLTFCDERGHPLTRPTIRECLYAVRSRLIYIRVKGLDGGALVRQFQSKQDKVAKLKAKAEAHLKTKVDATADVIVPEAMDAIIALFRQNLDNIIFLKGQGKDIIALGLHNAPTAKLEKVYELMRTPVKGRQDDCAEDRVLQAMLLLDPTAEKVNQCSQAMQKLEADFGLFYLHNYAERFHNEYGAELRFDLKSFAKMVENELESRGRSSVSAGTENAQSCNIA